MVRLAFSRSALRVRFSEMSFSMVLSRFSILTAQSGKSGWGMGVEVNIEDVASIFFFFSMGSVVVGIFVRRWRVRLLPTGSGNGSLLGERGDWGGMMTTFCRGGEWVDVIG